MAILKTAVLVLSALAVLLTTPSRKNTDRRGYLAFISML